MKVLESIFLAKFPKSKRYTTHR